MDRFTSAVLVLAVLSGTRTLLAQCRFKITSSTEVVTYRFSPEKTSAGVVLSIEMTFRVAAGIPVEVDVPSQFISDLRLEGSKAGLKDGPSGTKTITAPISGLVSLSYSLRNGWAGPLVHPHEFQPVILPQYNEITGDKALVWLSRFRDARVMANFDWQAMPPTWALATSFGVAEPLPMDGSHQDRTALEHRCQTYTGPWINVNQALFATGDFRLHPFKIGQRPGVLAIRGTWMFSDDEAADEIERTIRLVRDFWHDDAFPYFLVTLQPFDQDHGSSDGTAFTDAFWMYVSRKDNINGLLSQLAHESFHAWNPLKMGYLSSTEYDRTKWFKEGFTEYYAQRLTYAGGELRATKLVTSINKDFLAFPSSTNEYVRGRIIALWLDAAIRQESHGKHSLDAVMFQMVHDRKQPLTEERIFSSVTPYVSAKTLTLLKQAADQHGNLPAPQTVPGLGDCYHASHGNFPTFNLGLDYSSSQTTKAIAGIEPSGPAFQAGLRNGQPLVSSSFNGNDPNELAIFTVMIDGKEEKIHFKPLGRPVTGWQYIRIPGQPCYRDNH